MPRQLAVHSAPPSPGHSSPAGPRPDAVIYRPARSVTQSGAARTRRWVLAFEPRAPQILDPLMGWAGSTDPLAHVRLTFPTADAAIAFAARNGLRATVRTPATARPRRRSYAENFTRRPSA